MHNNHEWPDADRHRRRRGDPVSGGNTSYGVEPVSRIVNSPISKTHIARPLFARSNEADTVTDSAGPSQQPSSESYSTDGSAGEGVRITEQAESTSAMVVPRLSSENAQAGRIRSGVRLTTEVSTRLGEALPRCVSSHTFSAVIGRNSARIYWRR